MMKKPSLYGDDELSALLSGLQPEETPAPVAPVAPTPPAPTDLDVLNAITAKNEPSVGHRLRSFGLGAADAVSGAYGGRSQFLPQAIEDDRLKRSEAVKNYLTARQMEREGKAEERESERAAREREAFEAKRKAEAPLDDVASVQSTTLQGMAKRLDPEGDYAGLSARQLAPIIDDLRAGKKDAADLEMARLRLAQAKEEAAARREDRLDIKTAKAAEKEDKKKLVFDEIENRRENININIEKLKSMIAKDGTWEAFGSHNADIERLVDQIATDMAKLQDPNSVARPGEVELVKKNLVRPDVNMRNDTALSILNNFQNEVKGRADTAYTVRGYEPPKPKSEKSKETEEQEYERLKKQKAEREAARRGGKFVADEPAAPAPLPRNTPRQMF